MAEIVLSSFLPVLFEKLLSRDFTDLFGGRKLNKDLLLDLEMELNSVSKLVEDAEDRQHMDPRVEVWLDELKDAVYDAEDVLDEIATKDLQRKLDAELHDTTSKVRNYISNSFRPFAKKIEPKIKEVLRRLKDLASRQAALGLKEVGGVKSSERLTTSLVEQSYTFGRDDDKEKIINALLSNDESDRERMRVIAIVGIGGIGKTTLAQLVYNDERVKKYFELKAWIYVSEEFDVRVVTKKILEEIGSPTNGGSENLNGLQLTLCEKLGEKNFLVVLDDMWDENPNKWELLSKPLKFGGQRSAVIITTRNEGVASIVRTVPSHSLNRLSEADSWLLFAKHAFDNNNSNICPELEVIGRQIMKKCGGLPLAIKAIGRLLQWNLEVDKWEKILESSIWDLPCGKTEIHPSLRLSYKYLSSNLKRCFAYCSMFRYDIFLKEHITLFWMAEGLLQETREKTMEEVGHEYFLTLASMSFFEICRKISFFRIEDFAGELTDSVPFFEIHDLFSDLARSVSGQFGGRLVGCHSHQITEKTRHLSFIEKEFVIMKKSKDLYKAKRLHTFYPTGPTDRIYITNATLHDLFPMMTCLRVLCLRICINVTELPKSIVKMKHLRYLDLSRTGITKLPNSICKLYNLQTLNLAYCTKLATLPKDLGRLISLRYLNIEGTNIKEMQIDLGQLQHLQTLNKFVVSKHSRACIQMLGKLTNLQGMLSISELQNVKSPMDASKARLKDKKYLKGLKFGWNALDTSESQECILYSLEPHTNLKSLVINNYCAKSFPNWVGHHSFSRITNLSLENCEYCSSLPPLGQLCSLQKLLIVGLKRVVKVDLEFYGNVSKPFEALKILKLEEMLNWEEWSFCGAKNDGGAFPQLEELYIVSCPNLTRGLPAHLPSLAKLEISKCPQLVASIPKATAIRYLHLNYCNEFLLKELPSGLQRLIIDGFDSPECLAEATVNCSSSLQELTIGNCMKLELSAHLDFSSLEILELHDCGSLTSFPLDLFPKLSSMRIYRCWNLRSLTISEQHPRDLAIKGIDIRDCSNLISFPEQQLRVPNLEFFFIEQCPEIDSFPQVGRPCNLSSIRVGDCEKLFANRMEWGATEALQRKLDAEFQTVSRKVRNSMPTFFNPFVKKVEAKIEKVVAKLEYLEGKNAVLGLNEGGGRKPSERLPATSLVEESKIFGREHDKEKIVNLLLSDDASDQESVRVIAIVGTGGIGKTTLARLVYNDERVKDCFDLNAWACVSQEFDVIGVTKTVLEAVTSSSCDIKDFNRLQQMLQEKLMRKKFLIVLDDMWDEDDVKWEDLSNAFKSVARGSAVIVTTRNKNVASMMSPILSYHVDKLSKEDCWSLFAKYAFSNNNSEMRLKLEEIGRQIVEKCRGLPLAIKAIGGMLRSKLDVDEWEKILKCNLWDSPAGQSKILPALSLSYKDLSLDLKQCFAYFSIFPEDCLFSQDEIILLWMAAGLLKEDKNQTMEEVGRDYFYALRSRSLLEESSVVYKGPRFAMHDLVHDLAKSVSEQFIASVKFDSPRAIPNKVRHLSLWAKDHINLKKFKALYRSRRLHTFLVLRFPRLLMNVIYVTDGVLQDLFPMLRCLRMLSLFGCRNVTELPESIGKMKHLRYLNLSYTNIRMLPDVVCKLCNLQMLDLSYCGNLVVLPKDMRRLINLRYLDISGTNIKEMPAHLGQLQYLQTLTKFVVSKYDGAYIQELGKFPNLQGKLFISELQNVVDPINALQACLKDKKYLENLEFEWNGPDTSKCQRSVLNNFQPSTNLKSLTINGYYAESLPNWVGHHSFSNLTSLYLGNCKYCCDLPPLGQLCSLRNLCLVGLSRIVKLDHKFYGTHSSLIKPFGALKSLRFMQMLNWEEWCYFGAENENDGEVFPQLQELSISNCPKLIGQLPNYLPSLTNLQIDGCPKLVAALPRVPVIRDLRLFSCNDVLLREFPIGLRRLRIKGFRTLERLPKVVVDWSSSIQQLYIRSCQLELPTYLDLSSLEMLELGDCDSLKSFPLDVFPKLVSIGICDCESLESLTISKQHGNDIAASSLEIRNCPNFVSFPEGGLRAPNLTSIRIMNCGSLRSLPSNMCNLLPSLNTFTISDCPEVESFSEGGFPSSLKEIDIWGCKKLLAKRMEWGLKNYPFLRSVSIGGKSEDVESFPEQGLLPSSLFDLVLKNFENMKSLDEKGLQHLTSLRELRLIQCPNLKCVPKKGLPETLSTLWISECPLLKKQWQSKKGKDRRKIPNVDCIRIDFEYIR